MDSLNSGICRRCYDLDKLASVTIGNQPMVTALVGDRLLLIRLVTTLLTGLWTALPRTNDGEAYDYSTRKSEGERSRLTLLPPLG